MGLRRMPRIRHGALSASRGHESRGDDVREEGALTGTGSSACLDVGNGRRMMSIGLSEQGRWFDQRRRYSFAAGQLAGNAAGVDRSTDGRVSPRDRFAISWPPAHLVSL